MKDKRKVKTYKITQSNYDLAKERCDRKNGHLAVEIEMFVKCIGEGATVTVKTKENKKFTIGC